MPYRRRPPPERGTDPRIWSSARPAGVTSASRPGVRPVRLRWHGAHRGRAERRRSQADPDADEDEAGNQSGPARAAVHERAADEAADADEQQAAPDDRPGT